MKRWLWSILGLLGMLYVVSASAKERERMTPEVDPKLGGIGVWIKSTGPTPISIRPRANVVFFVRADSGVDVLNATDIIASNFSDKDQVYLLNAAPGKYVAVGAVTEGQGAAATNSPSAPSANLYFDKEMIPKTEVTVEPGQMAFMGHI